MRRERGFSPQGGGNDERCRSVSLLSSDTLRVQS